MKDKKMDQDFEPITIFSVGIFVTFVLNAIKSGEPFLLLIGLLTVAMAIMQNQIVYRLLTFNHKSTKSTLIALLATGIILFVETSVVVSLLY